jgi:hypothetical protein
MYRAGTLQVITPETAMQEMYHAIPRRCRRFRLCLRPRGSRARGETFRLSPALAVAIAAPVCDYVRSGTGGSRNATRRMGASRAAASGVLGVFRGFQRDGVEATLRRLNLGELVGRPPEDLFLRLTDVICQDGGSIDEGIARDAWLETISELDALGIDDAAALTAGQMQEIFLAYITHAIEARLFQDIGVNGLKIARDLAAIDAFETQLRSYIRRGVRDSFSGDLAGLATFSDRQISTIVDQTYRDAWEILVAWGDSEA